MSATQSDNARGAISGLAVAIVGGGMVVLWARWGPDWPAQEFRAWVASQHGLAAWTSQWYGGQPLWGYSVLYPLVAGPLGAPATGFLAVVVATWASRSLAPAGGRAAWFPVAVSASLIECLLIGQVPYLLGVAFAVGAVSALLSGQRGVWIALAAVGCSLSSPLAGLSLGVATPAIGTIVGPRRALWLLPCFVGLAVSKVAGGADGTYPFAARSLLTVVMFCVVCLVVTQGRMRAVNVFAACYLAVALLAFVVPNPVGGNIVRLGTMIAIPMSLWLVPRTRTAPRRTPAIGLVLLAAFWPSWSFTSAALRGADDPSQHEAYYAGLNKFLQRQNPLAGRVEIPFTREHWESLYVAKRFPIARGWERQSDTLYNDVLYHPLTPARYHRWLADNAVTLIALSRSPIDYGGRAEQTLLTSHTLTYLTPVWQNEYWQVWRVRNSRPMISGAAQLVSAGSSSVQLRFAHAGEATVRIRFEPLWTVTAGAACILASPGGWLSVRALAPGTVDLEAGLNDDLLRSNTTCRQ